MIREPDIAFIARENFHQRNNRYWSAADIVIEVVSPDDASRTRDYEQKVADYAEAKVAEYWIVDPQNQRVRILTLEASGYAIAGEFDVEGVAGSLRLPGFSVPVKAIFDAAKV